MSTTNGQARHVNRLEPSEVAGYQERLRAMMANLLVAEEMERRRLAADLHDGLTQLLALVAMKVASLRGASIGTLEKSLAEIGALVDQANRAARSIGYELSPPVLHDVGLEPAVQWLAENIRTRYGIDVTFADDEHTKPTDEPTRIVLFRGIRELLINAAKHASPKHVQVSLKRDGDDIVALVDDDGVGMDLDIRAARGSGLFAIRERIEHVGGSIEIQSKPGSGTHVRLRAPCLFESQNGSGVRT